MHMYTNPSNARAAAGKLRDKYPTLITVATPARAPGITPMFYATVTLISGATPTDDERTAIEDKAKVLTADEAATLRAEDAESAKAHASSKPKAKKAKAGKKPAKKAPAKKAAKPTGPKKESKSATAIALMSVKGGATAETLIDALGWQPHTLRGFVSIENKKRSAQKGASLIETVREKDKPTRYVLK